MRSTSVLAADRPAHDSSLAAESSPSSPSDPSARRGAGTFNLRITDSPYGSAKAVLVTFSEVAAHRDGDWTRLPFPGGGSTRTCDLKKLQNTLRTCSAEERSRPGSTR